MTSEMDGLARPWEGRGFLHVPEEAVEACLSRESVGTTDEARWNREGQRTLYLAGDPAVALSEYARHLQDGRSTDDLGTEVRELLQVEVAVDSLVDLREQKARDALGVAEPLAFLEEDRTRDISDRLRAHDGVQGFFAPPMAFLDRPDRWNLILFVDRLRVASAIRVIERRGCFRLDASGWESR
jgi:RES domain-containing protein